MTSLTILFLLGLTIFPVAGQVLPTLDRSQVEREVMALLDEFVAAHDRQDRVAEERTMHFPHYWLGPDGRMTVRKEPGAGPIPVRNEPVATQQRDWHHSAWVHRRILHMSDSKVHVDARITLHRRDGSIVRSFDSLLIVTKENGRWGIRMRSNAQ